MAAIRVVVWGLGEMGKGVVRALFGRPGFEVVGAIRANPLKAGMDLGEAAGLGQKTGVVVAADPIRVLRDCDADVVIHCTGSFLREIYDQLELSVSADLDVITIAEEMAFPWAHEPALADRLDRAAKEHGVTILGTGINPGFVLDTLILLLTAPCLSVERIHAVRVNDLSPYGPTVMRTQGVGLSPEEFYAGLRAGTVVGHVGFRESILLIASAVGWRIDTVEETREPIVSSTERRTPHVTVLPGMVAGCRHTARGFVGGREVIVLEHPQQVCPQAEGVSTGDYITIEGVPPVRIAITPEIAGGTGTVAMAINCIPLVLQSRPGLITMADLPLPRALLGVHPVRLGVCST